MSPPIEIVAPAASPEEAAAIVAALERFMHDTAPRRHPPSPPDGWTRVALLEAAGHDTDAPHPWAELGPQA